MNVVSAGLERLSSVQWGPWFAAAAIAASLPSDCKLAASQTTHICLGWTPPFEFFPGLAPFPVCWIWFVSGVFVGVVFSIFVALLVAACWLLKGLMTYPTQRTPPTPPRTEDARLELMQLLLQGGHDVLRDVAQQRGVEPSEFVRQIAGSSSRRVGVQPQPSRSPHLQ